MNRLNDRALVVRIEENGIVTGGIIIPDKAGGKIQDANIPGFGSGVWVENGERTSLEVNKCDQLLLYGKYAGNEVKIDVVECLVTREDDIFDISEK